MASALCIQGRHGFQSFINGTYEPTARQHHGRCVWVSHALRPLYLFHTGKSRWVISKRIDDGTKCYAFIQHTGSDPTKAEGHWTCCDESGAWRQDAEVRMTGVPASSDMFVQLRMTLDQELDRYGLNDPASLKLIWRRLDVNGNNIVSLAEVGKFVAESIQSRALPGWLNHQPALMRAFKAADLHEGDGDGWIEKRELYSLLLNIFWFNKLWEIFYRIDTNQDRGISVQEFIQGLPQLELDVSEQEAASFFNEIDRNRGGRIIFVEFCAYVRKRMGAGSGSGTDADIFSGENCGNVPRKRPVPGAGAAGAPQQRNALAKAMNSFNELEREVMAAIKDKRRLTDMWQRMDHNGNGLVSLAEIDNFVKKAFPLLDNAPASMRAYKAICKGGGSGEDFVQKREFKPLLSHIFYFNKIFWIFDHADADRDRRLSFEEFRWFINMSKIDMSEKQLRREYSQADQNGGGFILFDEFCGYFTKMACPECFADPLD